MTGPWIISIASSLVVLYSVEYAASYRVVEYLDIISFFLDFSTLVDIMAKHVVVHGEGSTAKGKTKAQLANPTVLS